MRIKTERFKSFLLLNNKKKENNLIKLNKDYCENVCFILMLAIVKEKAYADSQMMYLILQNKRLFLLGLLLVCMLMSLHVLLYADFSTTQYQSVCHATMKCHSLTDYYTNFPTLIHAKLLFLTQRPVLHVTAIMKLFFLTFININALTDIKYTHCNVKVFLHKINVNEQKPKRKKPTFFI